MKILTVSLSASPSVSQVTPLKVVYKIARTASRTNSSPVVGKMKIARRLKALRRYAPFRTLFKKT